jgi:hypothetical protein
MSVVYTPPQIARLAQLIDKHFVLEQLEPAVFIGLGRTVGAITRAPTVPGMILDVCQAANREERMAEFLEGLKSVTNPSQQNLHADFDIFSATGSYENTDPFATLLVTERPPVPVVNRQSLRECLRDLTNLEADYGAISIDGPRACGKTYSQNLIRHVAAWKGARAVVIEVVTESSALSLRATVDKITQLLGQPLLELNKLLRDQPSDAQTAGRFVDWIGGKSEKFGADGRQYWLLFDGLNHDAADPVRKCLVPPLLRAIANGNLLGVKVFLLGYDATRLGEAGRKVLHESARGIEETEIGDFITAFAAKHGWVLSKSDRSLLLSYIVGGAQSPFDHKALQGIRTRLETTLPRLIDPKKPIKDLLETVS